MLRFAGRHYADDPMWIPAPMVWERRRLGSALKRTERLVLLAAVIDGEIRGTISVLRDESFEKASASGEPKVAWFGYFESPDDPEIAAVLFDAARKQAAEWGADILRGPRNLTRFDFVGLTVSGHDRMPPMMQGHHHRYYQGLLEGAGLERHHDVYAYETTLLGPDGQPRTLPDKLIASAAGCQIDGLRIRAASRIRMKPDLIAAHTVLNEAYATVPDISPMPRATFLGLGRAMFTLAGPELIQLAFIGDRPVGFSVCLPELNEALLRTRGRLLPTGWLSMLSDMRRIQTAAFKLIGVVPDLRGSGLHSALIKAVVGGAIAAGYTRMDGSVIDERNKPMRGVVEGLGMSIYRKYRFFQTPI
ncbi:MAG: GNAT superfamily N-acetyltransferase [Myxococcota bacterium]